MHGRIADRLEEMLRAVSEPGQEDKNEAIGELAFHAFCAERWSDAFRYGREAAKSAEQRHAPHAILHYGQQTLFAATQQPDVATADDLLELHEQLGYAALLLGRKEDALDSFRQMLEAANGMDDQARVANALFRLAEVQERNYEHDQSAETRRVALALVTEQTAPQLLARFHFSLAHHGVAIGGLGEARNHLAEAERHAHAANDEQILIDSERLQVYLTIFQGAYAHGKRLTEMGLARARAAGDAPRVALACWQLGFILIERGEYGRANQTLLDGLEQDESIGEHHYYLIRIRNLLGYLHREVGDLASAMRWNQAALDTNRQDGSHHATECACYSLIDMAANHLAAGQIEASETWLRDFKIMAASATYGRYRYGNRAQLFQAELALARHEYDLALVHAKQAMEVAAADVMKKNIVRSLLFQGRALSGLGRLEEAVIQLQQSVALADDIGHASLRWQTRLALADVSQRSGRNSNNLRHEADELIRNIAGKLHDSHLRDAFLNSKAVAVAMEALTAADTDENRPVEARPAGLTRREIEVLSLVAAGLTDRQIAEQLHIALRTVNTHVTNILNKTGCDNRTAAAAFAVRHGLTDADS